MRFQMPKFAFVIILLVLPLEAMGQGSPNSSAESSVQRVFAHASGNMYTGWDAKDLNRLGDSAAVALTKIISSRQLDEDQIRQAVLIIRLSFASQKAIELESDKNPRTALFVLNYLALLPVNPEVRSTIIVTRGELSKLIPEDRPDLRR
jgi:hypothetical protein